jgi:excisionase family DNA binding protein
MGDTVPVWPGPEWDELLAEVLEQSDPETWPTSDWEMREAAAWGYSAVPEPASRRGASTGAGERGLLDIRQVAELLGCSRSYAYVLVTTAEIRSIKLGRLMRVPAEAVSEFIDRKLREADRQGAGEVRGPRRQGDGDRSLQRADLTYPPTRLGGRRGRRPGGGR